MASTTSLRAITLRLTTTPVNELPYVASYLATSLSSCSEITAYHEANKTTSTDVNDALQVNKLKARLTSLLQDRSFEGRWTAVVLIKTILEAGRWEILRDCGPWVSGLLGILSVRRFYQARNLQFAKFLARNKTLSRRRNYP